MLTLVGMGSNSLRKVRYDIQNTESTSFPCVLYLLKYSFTHFIYLDPQQRKLSVAIRKSYIWPNSQSLWLFFLLCLIITNMFVLEVLWSKIVLTLTFNQA